MVFKLRPTPPYPTPTQQDEHSGPVQPRKNTALPLPPVGGLFPTRSRINISVWSPSIFCGGLLLVSVTEKWGLLSSAQFSFTGLRLYPGCGTSGVHSSDCPHLCSPGSGFKPEEASQEDVMLLPPLYWVLNSYGKSNTGREVCHCLLSPLWSNGSEILPKERSRMKKKALTLFPKALTSSAIHAEKFKLEGSLKNSGDCGDRQLKGEWHIY